MNNEPVDNGRSRPTRRQLSNSLGEMMVAWTGAIATDMVGPGSICDVL